MTIKIILREGKTVGEFEVETVEEAARFWKARGETRGRKPKGSNPPKAKPKARKVKRSKPKATVAQP